MLFVKYLLLETILHYLGFFITYAARETTYTQHKKNRKKNPTE